MTMSAQFQQPSKASQHLTPAELRDEVTKIDVGGVHRRIRNDVLPNYPTGTRRFLMRRFLDEANNRPLGLPGWSRAPWMSACKDLVEWHGRLSEAPYELAFDADEIDLKARRCARLCLAEMRGKDSGAGLSAAETFAREQGITPPTPNPPLRTIEGCRRRLIDPAWWRRKLKTLTYRKTEAIERDNGLVQAMAGLYASDSAVTRRQKDKARSRAFLEETFAVNCDGACITLAEIADSTIANPKIRRAEMMTRLAGFEAYAKQRGHIAYFITLTTPSRFHAFRRNGDANVKYDGSNPAQGQAWLNATWARIRAKLHRLGVQPYGFRIAEPNHDGTPHWHMMLFVDDANSKAFVDVVTEHVLRESPNEAGAQEHRVTIDRIDTENGSATGYLAKYVSKNIDGHGVDLDFEDTHEKRSATENVIRVETWASLWGIRQFQQIGGPPVGVWRELRRISDPLAGKLEEARQAADDGDWCAYVHIMECGDIALAREWSDSPDAYGDPLGFQTIGVQCVSSIAPTREQEWVIVRDPEFATSRTCVNNRTPVFAVKRLDCCNTPPIMLDPTGPPIDCG